LLMFARWRKITTTAGWSLQELFSDSDSENLCPKYRPITSALSAQSTEASLALGMKLLCERQHISILFPFVALRVGEFFDKVDP